MAPSGSSSESFLHRALPIYLGLLFAILTVLAVVVLFMVRHVLLVLFVSVLFAAALTGPSEWLHRRFRLPLGLAAVGDLRGVLCSHRRHRLDRRAAAARPGGRVCRPRAGVRRPLRGNP